MAIDLGSTQLSKVALGSTKLTKVMWGSTPVWSGASVDTDFNLLGVLYDWFIDFAGDLVASITGFGGNVQALISDLQGNVFNGLGTFQGTMAKFMPHIDTSSGNIGTIVSKIPGALAESICTGMTSIGGMLHDLTNGGLVGFINGLPIIGGAFHWLNSFFTGNDPLGSITSLVGAVPVVEDLANLTGILQNASTGFMANPVNFLLDNLGNVVGRLSCGMFSPISGTNSALTYPIGSIGNMGRILLPDGLVSLAKTTSFARSQGLTGDNGWLQTGIATLGSPGFITRVFSRYDNTGAKTSGVGLHLMDGVVSIVRRVAGNDVLVAPALGNYAPGDDLILERAGDLFSLFRNGIPQGTWNDTSHTGIIGANNRSVGMAMQAAQDLLGPRAFSPSLSYVRAA